MIVFGEEIFGKQYFGFIYSLGYQFVWKKSCIFVNCLVGIQFDTISLTLRSLDDIADILWTLPLSWCCTTWTRLGTRWSTTRFVGGLCTLTVYTSLDPVKKLKHFLLKLLSSSAYIIKQHTYCRGRSSYIWRGVGVPTMCPHLNALIIPKKMGDSNPKNPPSKLICKHTLKLIPFK